MIKLGCDDSLPGSWRWVKAQDCIDVRDGTHDSPKRVESGIPLVTSKNLVDGEIDFSTCTFISEEDHEAISKRSAVHDGDILYAMIGTIGNPVIVEKSFDFSIKNVALFKFTNEEVHNRYIYHFLNSNLAEQQFRNKSRGGTQKFVSLGNIRELEIPLPPLAEQKRIAAILDKADAIRRKRQQAIQLADDFLRAVFLDMFGDIPAKKSAFELKGCRGAVTAASGKSSKTVLSEEPTDIPVYGGNGINGYATKALYDEQVIVVGRVGQQCAITNLTEGPCWVTDNAIVIQVTDKDKFNPIYLAHAFMHSPIRDAVTQLDLPFVNQQMILDHPIPHPPIELQNRFTCIRGKLLENIENQYISEGFVLNNFNALSQKAFSGTL